jgi:hypothetical protein
MNTVHKKDGKCAALPDYERVKDSLHIAIAAFWCPPPNGTQYALMAEAGFNAVVLDGKYGQLLGSKALFAAVELAGKYGIKAFPAINMGESADGDMRHNDYTGVAGFGGYYTDEPRQISDLDIINRNVDLLKARYPDREYWTTMVIMLLFGGADFEQTLDIYMKKSGYKQRILSFDFYPLKSDENGSWAAAVAAGQSSRTPSASGRWIAPEWLESLELMAKAAKEYKKDLYAFIADMSIFQNSNRRPTERDLRYQAYVSLAYGAKGIEHFCYMSPALPPFSGEFREWDWALIKPDYTDADNVSAYSRTETWYAAKNLNAELLAFDHVYLSFDWLGTLLVPGADAQTTAGVCFGKTKYSLKSHLRIADVKSTEDTVIGCFADKDGYDGFTVVNFSDPYENRSDKIKITFRDAGQAVVYTKGVKSTVDLKDGVYTAELEAGEGRFIIPV